MTDTPPPMPPVPPAPGASAATSPQDALPPADSVPPFDQLRGPALPMPMPRPMPMQQPPPVPGRDGKAVAAFVLGLLGVFPLSLIFGILALVGIGRTRQKGKVLAILGLVLSGLWTMVALVGVLGVVVYEATPGHSSALPGLGDGREAIASLPLGTCFNELPHQNPMVWATVVPCSAAHQRQVFARPGLNGTYPGVDGAKRQALLACQEALFADFTDPWALPGKGADLHYAYPVARSWQSGSPKAWCMVGPRNGDPTVSGDLRSPSSAYTAQQRGFLDAVRQTGLLRRELANTPAADWAAGRSIAAQLAVADRDEASALATLPALDTDYLRSAGQYLAGYDRAEAVRADKLARSASQVDWTVQTSAFRDALLTDEFDTIRVKLGLPTAL